MGIIFFMGLATVLVLLLMTGLWLITYVGDWDLGETLGTILISIFAIGVLIFGWISICQSETPYTNEENIARYELLVEKVEYMRNNPDSPYMKELYEEVDEWNKEYINYQENIGNWWDGICYPEDRYVGCNEIDFWEALK